MQLLKTFSDPVYPETGFDTQIREAARIVMKDENNLYPIIYASNYDYYKIPGGGIDVGEEIHDAVKREALEECGCEIEILGEIGKTEELRSATKYKWTHNMKQISYGFYGKVVSKGNTDLSESEIQEGFQVLWLNYEEAVERFTNCKPQHCEGILMNERDKTIFIEGCKKLYF